MRIRLTLVLAAVVALGLSSRPAVGETDIFDRVTHGYANDNGVQIHYATLGRRGRLIVMIHGFPDFWYTWRDQMRVLSHHYRVVAIDQRGYNLSDKPAGVDAYNFFALADDVAAVIRDLGEEHAVIVGHDWGGAVAWGFALAHPEMTDGLVILNSPHPRALFRELRNNPAQQAASQYARDFQEPDAHLSVPPEALAVWVTDPAARVHYTEALGRSDPDAMLNYYKANYPREPYTDGVQDLPPVKCSVLMIHGLKDKALLPGALNDTWKWVEKDFTLVTIPDAEHFVQQDAADQVTKNMVRWLTQ